MWLCGDIYNINALYTCSYNDHHASYYLHSPARKHCIPKAVFILSPVSSHMYFGMKTFFRIKMCVKDVGAGGVYKLHKYILSLTSGIWQVLKLINQWHLSFDQCQSNIQNNIYAIPRVYVIYKSNSVKTLSAKWKRAF